VRRRTVAVDAGLVINPDGEANQIEGGAIQSTNWTVKEGFASIGTRSPVIPRRPVRSCASPKFPPSTSTSCPAPTTRHSELLAIRLHPRSAHDSGRVGRGCSLCTD
jgi:hypothetical protein